MKTLFVFAHPDDETFTSGGTIALLTKKGEDVVLAVATRGEAGSVGEPPLCTQEELGRVREQELRDAAKVLGIQEIYFLDFIDGTLPKLPQGNLQKKISDVIEKEKPDVVVTFDKLGISNHPDHIAVSEAATSAFNDYIKKAKKHARLYHTAFPQSQVKKFEAAGVVFDAFGKMKGTPDQDVSTTIDIAETNDLKLHAFRCHKTQHKDMDKYVKGAQRTNLHKECFKLIAENTREQTTLGIL